MQEAKPFASLGPTLLARKGGAKPAMRPQLTPLTGGGSAAHALSADLDDLGWNDMGDGEEQTPQAQVLPFGLSAYEAGDEDEGEYEDDNDYASLAPAAHAISGDEPEDFYESKAFDDEEEGEEDEDDLPSLEAWAHPAPVEPEPESAASVAAIVPAAAEPIVVRQQRALSASLDEEPRPARRASADGRRAAFTLRLDATRHLKLRLASTVKNRSSQQLVTQALDEFLARIPELDALTAQLKRD
jgi:hypothetical protein